MTIEELKQHDGQNGRNAYVAVNGKIYDVTSSHLWQKGDHEGAHQAGNDLSEELKTAPHVRSLIERFPVIDQLEEKSEKRSNLTGIVIAISIVVVATLLILVLRN